MANQAKLEVVEPPKPGHAKVKVAHLQTGVTVDGHLSSDTNLNPSKFPTLKMSVNATDLVLEFADGKIAWVPRTNVKVMLLG